MTEQETQTREPAYRLNIKKNFKGELGYEYTVRADTIPELTEMSRQVKALAESEVNPQ